MDKSPNLPRLIRSDGQEIVIHSQFIIGRSPECSLQITESQVSRQHAQIKIVNQQVFISDLGSRNGTWVNDQKITSPTKLTDGDRVRISKKTIFVFKAAAVFSPEDAVLNKSPISAVKERKTASWQITEPLTLVRSEDGTEFGLNRDIRIGRDEANDLVLERDSSASQFHCKIELSNGQVVISDLNSHNGSWVNGKRITGQKVLKHGDQIRLGDTVFRLQAGEHPMPVLTVAVQPSKARRVSWGLLLIGVIAVMLLGISLIVLPRIQGNSSTPGSSSTEVSVAAETQPASVIQTALRALVFVKVPVLKGYYFGSGSLLNENGYILTNAHVIAENIGVVLIGINWADPQAAPDTFYHCEIVKTDDELDLAVLHITRLRNGESLIKNDFPFLPVGDSDDLNMGDPITIIGFPGTGGETPTLSGGEVAGFLPDEDLNVERGWIKTDAEVSQGNSGGMAIDQEGKLIGVPTWGKVSETGKISYVRPINPARSFIQEYLP